MKAKELVEKLMENPEATVCVWLGEPNECWEEIRYVDFCSSEYIETDGKFQKKENVIKVM